MTGPKTLNAAIRASHERSPAAAASRRYRVRKRGGYVRTGPVDVPPELVWAMVELGILGAEHVTQDGRYIRVDPGIMAEAQRNFLDQLADCDGDLLDFLKDNIPNEEPPHRIDDTTFLLEIGLPGQAKAMRFDRVVEAIEKVGYEVQIVKKSLSDQ